MPENVSALELVLTGDPALFAIVRLSLIVSLSAVLLAALVGLPLGAWLALSRFRGRGGVIVVLNALMGLPPVVVGDNGAPARLELGQLLEVRLPVQGGTGYSWSVDADAADNVELVTQTTLHPIGEGRRMGSSQTQLFIFRAIARGQGVLRFAYRRPWEQRVAPARTVELQVSVRR